MDVGVSKFVEFNSDRKHYQFFVSTSLQIKRYNAFVSAEKFRIQFASRVMITIHLKRNQESTPLLLCAQNVFSRVPVEKNPEEEQLSDKLREIRILRGDVISFFVVNAARFYFTRFCSGS